MSVFCEDDRQNAEYPNGIFDEPREKGTPFIKCLQWDARHGKNHGHESLPDARSLIDIARQPTSALRVVFLPLRPARGNASEFKSFEQLVQFYSIPSAVLAERMRRVSYSFGSAILTNRNAEIAWCHFLCRNVHVKEGLVQDLGYLSDNLPINAPSSLWTMCDFYLHIRRESTDPSGDKKAVTLLCFGAPSTVRERFGRLLQKRDAWLEAMEEPFLMFDVLFDQLHQVFDDRVWRLYEAVRPEEKSSLQRAGGDRCGGSSMNFQNLHNIQKNSVLMIEAAEANMATLEAIAEKFKEHGNSPLAEAAAKLIGYRKRSFHSTLLRLKTFEKRSSNIIQLTFNHNNMIAIADGAAMKDDSRAMKFIAFLTMIFLPATGVASIFSTPFFDIDSEGSETGRRTLRTANNFWIFWVIVLPLTSFGLLLYLAYMRRAGTSNYFSQATQIRQSGRSGKRDIELGPR